MFGGRAETMRTLLILAATICFSASALAQTGAPKVGGKPLKQVKPVAPMGCKLVGTVKGTKLWAGDCAPASELRGSTPAVEPSAPAQPSEANPPAEVVAPVVISAERTAETRLSATLLSHIRASQHRGPEEPGPLTRT